MDLTILKSESRGTGNYNIRINTSETEFLKLFIQFIMFKKVERRLR